jgi:hypothetical protein
MHCDKDNDARYPETPFKMKTFFSFIEETPSSIPIRREPKSRFGFLRRSYPSSFSPLHPHTHTHTQHQHTKPLHFRRNEQPSVNRALPPLGWQRTVEQPAHMTTVWACEKTVVMVKQPGHLTSIKNDRGPGTRAYHRSLLAVVVQKTYSAKTVAQDSAAEQKGTRP